MRVLVVDDAPYMLKVMRDILGAYGHEIHEARNGEEAIEAYDKVKPDVVLMDILMPGLDGISATRRILERDPGAQIVVITAMGKIGLEKECLEAGAKRFVVKPFKIKELVSSIDSLGGR